MTFSVLALDRGSSAIGCAAATGNLAVGAWVLRAAAQVGAVATQGFSVSSLWGDQALLRLAHGDHVEEIIAQLTGPDAGRDYRQLAVLDVSGRGAAWTGVQNTDFKDHIIGPDYVISGNWLAGPAVLTAMEQALRDTQIQEGKDALGQRLLAALGAGVQAGSDARGTLSAALRIVHPDHAPLDLRVDYDQDPLTRLRSLYDMATHPPYSEWVRQVPTLNNPYQY